MRSSWVPNGCVRQEDAARNTHLMNIQIHNHNFGDIVLVQGHRSCNGAIVEHTKSGQGHSTRNSTPIALEILFNVVRAAGGAKKSPPPK